jgi:GxxExxY protein
MFDREITETIIGCAIEVHKELGPGLLESAYEECLCHELIVRNIPIEHQVVLPIVYKGNKLNAVYRVDLLVNKKVVVELKCIEKLLPIHDAQLITYLKLTGIKTGLLLNFNSAVLKDGIRRMVL